MKIFLFIKQALSSIIANKLRSFLSTLWIIIWISSFVIMLSLWEGAKQSILKDFWDSWNIIWVSKKYWKQWKLAKSIFVKKIIWLIEEKVPWIDKAWIKYNWISKDITYKDKNIWANIDWIEKWYLQYKKIEIQYWSLFDEKNYKNSDKICILWHKLISSNFWKENPIWKKINIWWEVFIIWWILKEKDWDFDYKIFIPSSTLNNIFNQRQIERIEVFAKNEKIVWEVKRKLDYFLFKKSFVENKKKVSYRLRTNKEELKQVNWFIKKFSLLLAWVWAISLIVWWIWIMNIMLVSVTERTREIWIRKAIWATNKNIMLQFLIESIILTLIWSWIAVWLSYWIVKVVDWFIPDFSPVVNLNVLLIAIWVSVWMWIIFWLMPAYKAAKLKPIDALVFE